MMKYRVSGTGIHSITLAFHKSGKRKEKIVFWFDDLPSAKQQVLDNQKAEVARLIAEKEQVLKRLELINEHIEIMSKPLNLDVITDDYLIKVNERLAELNEKIQRGDNIF